MSDDMKPTEKVDSSNVPEYEAPAIEEIVTAQEMEREVHYAGVGSQNMN